MKISEKKDSSNDLKLFYQSSIKDQNINISELRPGGSYNNLIEKRSHALKPLLKNGKINKEYLI